MVLSASAPPDAPRPHEPDWIERLTVILRLAERGVLVLVDNARPERLGDLVRALLRLHPELWVHTDARRILSAPKGAVIVLAVDPAQAEWLNLERPIVAHRELRLILFSDAETSAVLARRAVDFFHWISHRIECPEGVSMPAVRTIRAAVCARARGIAWHGSDLPRVFDAALPGRTLSWVSASLPYEKLVEAARPGGREWAGFTDANSIFRVRRVSWALAEAGRRGRALLVDAAARLPDFWPVNSKLRPLGGAISALEGAGALHAGRLAALLDLEPAAIDTAAELLRAGVPEQTIEDAAAFAEDPGLEVTQLALQKKIKFRRMSSLLARAIPRAMKLKKSTPEGRSSIEAMLRDAKSNPALWGNLSRTARQLGDGEVAERWATRLLETTDNRANGLLLLGQAMLQRGHLARAVEALRESDQLYARATEPAPIERVAALDALGRALYSQGSFADAESTARRALALIQKTRGADHPESVRSMALLSDVLLAGGKYEEPARLLEQARAIDESLRRAGSSPTTAFLQSISHMLLEQGYHAEAEARLRAALEQLDDKKPGMHLQRAHLLHELGRSLLGQGQHDEAEPLLQDAITLYGKQQQPIPARLQIALGAALIDKGDYAQSERILREALTQLEGGERRTTRAEAIHELSQSLIAQGKYADAEPLLRRAVELSSNHLGKRHSIYADSIESLAHIAIESGRAAEAESHLREALSVREQMLGREHPYLASTLNNLAIAIDQQDRPEEAERTLKRALRLSQSWADPIGLDGDEGREHQAQIASILELLALTQARMGRRDAADTARRALNAYILGFGETDPRTTSAATRLASSIEGKEAQAEIASTLDPLAPAHAPTGKRYGGRILAALNPAVGKTASFTKSPAAKLVSSAPGKVRR